VGDTRRRKGGDHTLTALKSIRAARPDGALDISDGRMSASPSTAPLLPQHVPKRQPGDGHRQL